MQRFEEARVLGVHVQAVDSRALVQAISEAVRSKSRLVVGNHNLNSLALVRRSAPMRAFYGICNIVYADGMPVVTIARLLGYAFGREHRITSLDFIGDVLRQAAASGWRVFYLGSTQDVIVKAAEVLRSEHRGLQLFVRNGYFDTEGESEENAAVIAEINSVAPDILIVGMGMPRQEEWVWRNHGALNATVLFPIGALADYLAGAIPTPPRWSGRWGLEWAFRLVAEPKRLGRRYLVEPWVLVWPLTLEWLASLRGRRSPEEPESKG